MAVMSVPPGELCDRPLTVADLAQLPDDGNRYELVDGRLDVSPRPAPRHLRAQSRLGYHLIDIAPDGFEVLPEPGIWLDAAGRHYRTPDLVVLRSADFTADVEVKVPPVLAVEVLSPESVFRDTDIKRREYAAFGVGSYWIVNPDPVDPGILELRLDGGEYHEAAQVFGGAALVAEAPFPVTIMPRALVTDGPWKGLIGATERPRSR